MSQQQTSMVMISSQPAASLVDRLCLARFEMSSLIVGAQIVVKNNIKTVIVWFVHYIIGFNWFYNFEFFIRLCIIYNNLYLRRGSGSDFGFPSLSDQGSGSTRAASLCGTSCARACVQCRYRNELLSVCAYAVLYTCSTNEWTRACSRAPPAVVARGAVLFPCKSTIAEVCCYVGGWVCILLVAVVTRDTPNDDRNISEKVILESRVTTN